MRFKDERLPASATEPGAAAKATPMIRLKKASGGGRLRPRSSALNPFAEMMLEQLKDQLSVTASKDAVACELTKAARRFDRKKIANSEAFASTSGQVRSDLRGIEDLPLDMAYEIGRDPREDEPGFRNLPPMEQQRLRQQWEEERQRLSLRPLQQRRVQLHLLLSAIAVYAVVGLLLAPFRGVAVLPGMLASGLLTGMAWLPLRRTRFAFALVGVLVFAFGKGFAFAVTGADLEEISGEAMTMLFTAIVVTFGCGLVGFDCEMRMSGGFRQG